MGRLAGAVCRGGSPAQPHLPSHRYQFPPAPLRLRICLSAKRGQGKRRDGEQGKKKKRNQLLFFIFDKVIKTEALVRPALIPPSGVGGVTASRQTPGGLF